MDVLVTFCIPSYNRAEKVHSLVSSILKYRGDDISVLVIDNSSTDNTFELLQTVNDTRLEFVENTGNVGGIMNVLQSLLYAKGEYAFLCLDKDFVDGAGIALFIQSLKQYDNVAFGYCKLNTQHSVTGNSLFTTGYQSVLNMGYLSSHPSGRFYRTQDYCNMSLKLNIPFDTTFAFWLDIINAEMALKGNSLLVDIPLVYTERKEDCAEQKSYTYSNNNAFFYPQERMIEYSMYMMNLNSLPLKNKKKRKLLKLLFFRGLHASTYGFKNIMLDEYLCTHYHIDTRTVRFSELIRLEYSYYKWFLGQKCQSIFYRVYLCFYAAMRQLLKYIFKAYK